MCDLWDRHCASKVLAAAEILNYGTYAGIQLGLIAEPTECGDSTFADLSAVDANEADTYFGTEVNKTKLLNALSLAIATKACWWNTNHHLGGEHNKLGAICKKYLQTSILQQAPILPRLQMPYISLVTFTTPVVFL